VLGFLSLPHLRQGWFFNLISLSSPVAIVVAVRMWKPNARAPWYLFALGQTFFVIGDVITYSPPPSSGETGLITHRIYSIKNHGKDGFSYRTKGDANPTPDPWRFQLDQPTQATVAFAIPYLGYGIAALSVLPIRMIIIGLPALLIAIALIARMWREAGEEARARNAAILARQPAAAQQPLQPVQPVPVQPAQQPVMAAAQSPQTPAPSSQGGAVPS
jgi:signal peptidase I